MTTAIVRISRPQEWRHGFIRTNGYRCHYCNRPGGLEAGPDARPWHVDHMTALASGGEDVVDNLALACMRCNTAKGTQSYSRFRRYAQMAFWVDVAESAPDKELDELIDAYLDTDDGVWHLNSPPPGKGDYEVLVRTRGRISNEADLTVATFPQSGGRTDKGRAAAIFLVRAHRIVPDLVAELRTLRAELAEARGEQQDPEQQDPAQETSVA